MTPLHDEANQMPNDDNIPNWPPSMPADLPPDTARDLERRQVLNNVRELAARVENMKQQLKVADLTITSLHRENERRLESIAKKVDENTELTEEVKALMETIKGGKLAIGFAKRVLLGAGAVAGAVIAIIAAIKLLPI